VGPLKITTPVKTLDKQLCAEGFNFGVKGLKILKLRLKVHFVWAE
jgi:hypothetical protein